MKHTVTVDLSYLKELRERNGYALSDMAAKLGYKTPTAYWLIEKGERKISVETLYNLSKIYDVEMEQFLTAKD